MQRRGRRRVMSGPRQRIARLEVKVPVLVPGRWERAALPLRLKLGEKSIEVQVAPETVIWGSKVETRRPSNGFRGGVQERGG